MEKLYHSTSLLYMFSFFIGAITTFALTPFSFLPIFFALGYGICVISQISSLKKTFLAAWFLGFGWFSFGLYWIGSAFFVADTYHIFLMPLSVIVLPSILAIFWGGAFYLAKLVTPKTKSPILFIIINLSLLEYCRAHIFSGFPWLMPSMVLSSNEYILQIMSYVGSFTGNVIVITFSVLPTILFFQLNRKKLTFSLLFLPILILLSSSLLRFHNKEVINKNDNQLIVLVQPNIRQKDKWNLNKREEHLKKLVELSIKNKSDKKDQHKIIIWPETSFEGSIPKEIKLLSDISKKIIKNKNTTLVVGLLSFKNKELFNSLVFLNSNGEILYKYDKIHLVPFGEYIPFRKNFMKVAKFLSPGDFASGKLKENFTLKGFGSIVSLICYEILFSNEVNKRVSNNTKLLINITNDAWFGKTVGPYHHLDLAKIRAVELGLPLVRVANTGISAFISPYGEEIIRIPLYKEGVESTNLIPALNETIYKKFGEYTFIISILFILFINYFIFWNFRKGKINEE